MENPHPLGTLSKLPYDVRHIIWSHFSPFDTALLQINSYSRQEIKDFLQNMDICFTISPTSNTSSHISEIRVHDQHREYDALYPPLFATDYPEFILLFQYKEFSRYQKYSKLPYELLKSVTIKIEAPVGFEDPGQFVRCWNSTCWLVNLLSNAHGISRLELIFVETPERTWFDEEQMLQKSMECEAHECRLSEQNDLRRLLLPFSRFRACDLSIELPKPSWLCRGPSPKFQRLLASMREDAGQRTPVGDNIERLQNTIDTWLDYFLDDMGGPCAAVLRRERLFFWGEPYRTAHRKRLKGPNGANLQVLGKTEPELQEAYRKRHPAADIERHPLNCDCGCGDPDSDGSY